MTTAIYHTATMKKNAPKSPVPLPYPQTPESAANYIRSHGLCVSTLARDNNLPRHTLVDLLRGQLKGKRGEAHRAAILLGLKQNPETVQ